MSERKINYGPTFEGDDTLVVSPDAQTISYMRNPYGTTYGDRAFKPITLSKARSTIDTLVRKGEVKYGPTGTSIWVLLKWVDYWRLSYNINHSPKLGYVMSVSNIPERCYHVG